MNDAHRIIFQPSGRQGEAPGGANLLDAARSLGVEIEAICGGRRTCGKCQVIIEAGVFPEHGVTSAESHVTPIGAREARNWAQHPRLPGRRLACACEVVGDLVITVPEESQARKQIVRKAAVERTIEIDPAVRLCYVEIEPPTMASPLGEWDRIAAELARRFDLPDVRIDPVLLGGLQETLRAGDWKATVSVWQGREAIRVAPGYDEGVYGVAVDIGTTTIACHLCDLRTGRVLATAGRMNPQVPYGEDLMSRVSTCDRRGASGLATLRAALIAALNALAAEAAAGAGIAAGEVTDAVLVGNSVMHHILLGIPPHELGQAPFSPAISDAVDIAARDLGLELAPGARAHVLPLEAGHVGADNVAAILAEAPHRAPAEEIWLLVDVGTNSELVLGNRTRLLSASSPTGPAFEGAQIRHGMRAAPGAIERVRVDPETLAVRFKVIGRDAWSDAWDGADAGEPARGRRARAPLLAAGICGSGIIEAVAELFLAGVLAPDGRFAPEVASPRLSWQGARAEFVLAWPGETSTGRPIVITSDDVRNIQLAKAALYAGARLLMARIGVVRVDRVLLAGAFGSTIDPFRAMAIGMMPDCDPARVVAVGNSAGDGARIALLDLRARAEARRLARWTEHVGIALEAGFQEAFVAAMPLPHAADDFPHLRAALAGAAARRRARGVADGAARRRRGERPA